MLNGWVSCLGRYKLNSINLMINIPILQLSYKVNICCELIISEKVFKFRLRFISAHVCMIPQNMTKLKSKCTNRKNLGVMGLLSGILGGSKKALF